MMKSALLLLLILLVSSQWSVVNGQNSTCESSENECVNSLLAETLKKSAEVKFLDEAVALAKRKQWTSYIDISTIDPVSASLQLIKNLFGGGKRQESKQLIKSLELKKAELVENYRRRIFDGLVLIESLKRKNVAIVQKIEFTKKEVELIETQYRFGDYSTESMLKLWELQKSVSAELEENQANLNHARKSLYFIIYN